MNLTNEISKKYKASKKFLIEKAMENTRINQSTILEIFKTAVLYYILLYKYYIFVTIKSVPRK